MKNINFFFSLILLQAMVVFTAFPVNAGTETAPPTLSHSVDLGMVETLYLSHTKADIAENENSAHGLPDWAGFSLTTHITPDIAGNVLSWPDGGKSWTMRASSPGAPAISLVFEDARLAPHSILYVYNENNPSQYYAITAAEIVGGYISTPPTLGDAVIIEYHEPYATQGLQGTFTLTDLVVLVNGYEAFQTDDKDLGNAAWCLININCEEGDNWQVQKRGVARLLLRVGTQWGWCSGSLVNNTAQDGTPYMLTADHCGSNASAADRNVWQFFFNFERPGCANTGTPPNNLLVGCQLRARGPLAGGSDFQLVQLNSTPPETWNPYFNGWDRNNTASPSGVGIHHPAGDAKKISTYTSNTTTATPTISGQTMGPQSAWRVFWSATVNGHSVTQGGSSGSPLFNPNGLIIGTLSGGSSQCNAPNNPDFYGKFSYSWASNGTTAASQLEPWLDPIGSGVTTLNGFDPYAEITPNFVASKLIVNLEEEVVFTNTTFGGEPETFEWSFGEDAVPPTASGFGPHTVYYTSSGHKDVSLTVNDTIVVTKENYIYVRGIQTATFHVTDQNGDPVENAMISVTPVIGGRHFILEEKSTDKSASSSQALAGDNNPGMGMLSAKAFDPVMTESSENLEKSSQWIHWDNGENANGIGTGGAVTFSAASRWEPADLAEFDEHVITSIKFFPRELNATYTLKIWTGTTAQEVYAQPVVNPAINTWNTVELITPHFIDNTQELWFGYQVNAQAGHPAGTDAGPHVAGKGNMILWNNNWVQLNSLNADLTFNWNLQAWVQEVPTTVIFTDANGQAEFEDWDGTYNYTVEKENYQTFSSQFTMMGSNIDVPVTLYDDDGKFTIHFNVNMFNVDGFDADTDNVFLTGSFTDWAEPGSENSVHMQRVANKSDEEVVLHENFSSFPPAGWQLQSTSSNTWQQAQSLTIGSVQITPVEGTHFTFCNWHATQAQDEKLITPSLDLTILQSGELSFHFFGNYHWSVDPNDNCDLFVKVSVNGGEWVQIFTETDHPLFIDNDINYLWLHTVLDINDYIEYSDVRFMFQYTGTDGAQFGIDAVKVSGMFGEEIFTATLRLEPGDYEYKYFSDAFGAGWDGGEWEGDPNRKLEVEDHMTLLDRWADYTPDYELTLEVNPIDAGVVTGAGTYPVGEMVTVSAFPEEDFIFLNWTDGETVVSTDAEYTFEMPGNDLTLTANFEAIPYYDLTLLASPPAGGTVNGAGSYQAGTLITVSATANQNYAFVRWVNEGNIGVSSNPVYTFSMPAHHMTLTAEFDLESTVGNTHADELAIYPNPFNSSITIANATQVSQVKITNLMGQTVRLIDHNDNDIIQINTADLPAGIYLIHCTTHEGSQTVSKIIKR